VINIKGSSLWERGKIVFRKGHKNFFHGCLDLSNSIRHVCFNVLFCIFVIVPHLKYVFVLLWYWESNPRPQGCIFKNLDNCEYDKGHYMHVCKCQNEAHYFVQ
jgi:hypothetical protein